MVLRQFFRGRLRLQVTVVVAGAVMHLGACAPRRLPFWCVLPAEAEVTHGKPQQRRGNPGPWLQYLVPPDGRGDGAGHACRLRLSRSRDRAPEEPGQCPVEDHHRLRRIDPGVLPHRLLDRLWRDVHAAGRSAGRRPRLCPGEVLLPADLCCGDPGDHLRRHRRACALRSAAVRDAVDRGVRISVLRRADLERQFRFPGLAGAPVRCTVP